MSTEEVGAISRNANLAMAFQELFTAVVRLRFNRQSAPNAEVFRSHMRDAYRLAAEDAQGKNYSSEAVQMAGYAVIAFLDESVVGSRNFVFANWSLSPLQKELFPQVSGETFFRTVDELLAAPDAAETVDILEVYLLAILLGYRGRYAIGGSDELANVMQKMKEKIVRVRGDAVELSPAWAVPNEPIAAPAPDAALKLCFTVAAASLAACLVTFAVCKFLLLSGAGEIHSLLK